MLITGGLLHRFAAFLDCVLHPLEIIRRYAASKSNQAGSGHPLQLNFGKLARKF